MALRSLSLLEAPALCGVWDGEFSRVEIWLKGSFQPLKPKRAAKKAPPEELDLGGNSIADDGAKAGLHGRDVHICPFAVHDCFACNMEALKTINSQDRGAVAVHGSLSPAFTSAGMSNCPNSRCWRQFECSFRV